MVFVAFNKVPEAVLQVILEVRRIAFAQLSFAGWAKTIVEMKIKQNKKEILRTSFCMETDLGFKLITTKYQTNRVFTKKNK